MNRGRFVLGGVVMDFAVELEKYTGSTPNAQLNGLVERLRQPIGVAVTGRPGVGSSTVAEALRRRGVHVVDAPMADLLVLVIAEVVKPEDRAALASELPGVMVLTKADLCRPPLESCAVPMSGLLAAVSTLDEESVAALRSIADEPLAMGSVDAFCAAPHPVDQAVRTRLLERLDRFGVVTAARALAAGQQPAAVVDLLHRLSNVDAVLARLDDLAAEASYRRVRAVLAELRVIAASGDDGRLWRFLGADATVAALTVAALDVLEAGPPEAPARCAIRWSRYARGPVNALHRSCAADVVRGSLRRLDHTER
jgi:hypothetical protein